MLKTYLYNGKQWQFEEKEAPAGAVEVKAKPAAVPNKAKKPANKARKVATK